MGGGSGKAHKYRSKRRLHWLIAICLVLAVLFISLLTWLIIIETNREDQTSNTSDTTEPADEAGELTGTPQLSTETVVQGRQNIWDVAFLPSGEMLFTERHGMVSLQNNGELRPVADIQDVYATGEGGLMGLVVDPDFKNNRYIYTCFNSELESLDVRVVRWRLADNLDSLEDRTDIVTGIPSNDSGRHSGCRIAFGDDGYLWVATGDAAQGTNPQDPKSLGGKLLRVDRDGQAAERGNLAGDFDPRIYSYGHRNSQGLAMLMSPRDGIYGISTEHGPGTDDEINLLKPGNFGWNPVPGYNESVPMTDTSKYPEAIPAIWSSGQPTQALSGATFVYGNKWRDWSGALMVTALKDQKLKVFSMDDNLQVANAEDIFQGKFGRLRAAVQGPDESLYLATDNGEDDKIIRVTPQ